MKNFLKVFFILVLAISCIITLGSCDNNGNKRTKENYDLIEGYAAFKNGVATFTIVSDDEVAFTGNPTEKDVKLYSFSQDDEYKEIKEKTVTVQNERTLIIKANVLFEDISYGYSVEIGKDFSSTGNKLVSLLNNEDYIVEPLVYTDNEAQEILDKLAEIKNILQPKKGIMNYITMAKGYYDKAQQVLIMLGVIEKKDPMKEALDHIQETIDEVNTNLKQMDNYLKQMNADIMTKLDSIEAEVKKANYTLNSQTWNNYYDQFIQTNGMNNIIDVFNAIYQQCYVDYFLVAGERDFTIYYDKEGNITYPISTLHEPGEKWMSIDDTEIDEAKVITVSLNDETFKHVKALTKKVFDDKYFVEAVEKDLKEALLTNELVNDTNVQKYLYDAYCVLEVNALKEAMDSKTGSGAKVCNEIINRFNYYTDASTRTTDNPLEAYRNLIVSNFNFQSEAKSDLDMFNAYIYSSLCDFRGFAELAVKYGSVSEKESLETIAASSDLLYNWMEANDGFVPEIENAQYCYHTNTYVRAKQFKLTQSMELHVRINHRVFVLTGLYKGSDYHTNWSVITRVGIGGGIDMSNVDLLNGQDVQKLNATFVAMKNRVEAINKDREESKKIEFFTDFKDYFFGMLNYAYNTDVIYSPFIKDSLSSILICKGDYTAQDFTKDGSVTLPCLTEAFKEETFPTFLDQYSNYFKEGKEYRIGTESETNKAKASKFTAKVVKGNVFDMGNQTYKSNEPLIYGAIYGHSEKKWKTDEAFMFGKFGNFTNIENYSDMNIYNDAIDKYNHDDYFYVDMTLMVFGIQQVR